MRVARETIPAQDVSGVGGAFKNIPHILFLPHLRIKYALSNQEYSETATAVPVTNCDTQFLLSLIEIVCIEH